MNYATIDVANAKVSRLGFGAMRLPLLEAGDPTSIDMGQVQQMVDLAIEKGVNYFDTAFPYHSQKSELALGRVLAKYPRESYYLATKFPLMKCEDPAHADEYIEEQLRRLNTDYIDFYMLHGVQRMRFERLKTSGMVEKIRSYKADGRVRNIGFSFHDTPAVLEEILTVFPDWDFVQVQLNYLDWTMQDAKEIYRILEERGIAIIVMEPVRGGFLANLPDEYQAIFDAADPSRSQASWALRWVAELPQVKVILSGMSNLQQMQDNLATFETLPPFTAEEKAAVDAVAEKLLSSVAVPCTGCAYCMPCPFGVNIPACFNFYNRYKLTGMPQELALRYQVLVADGQDASFCQECGACTAQCPQHIEIPTVLKEIRAKAEELAAAHAKRKR